MDDFDFSDEGHERDSETGAWGPWGGNYDQARVDQGFDEPFDRSPVDAPPGWYGGSVKQTGGMTMVREWHTTSQSPGRTREKRREHEYTVGYNGDARGVSLQRYQWSPQDGFYVFDKNVDKIRVPRGTDMAKARAARKLMERHHGRTR